MFLFEEIKFDPEYSKNLCGMFLSVMYGVYSKQQFLEFFSHREYMKDLLGFLSFPSDILSKEEFGD